MTELFPNNDRCVSRWRWFAVLNWAIVMSLYLVSWNLSLKSNQSCEERGLEDASRSAFRDFASCSLWEVVFRKAVILRKLTWGQHWRSSLIRDSLCGLPINKSSGTDRSSWQQAALLLCGPGHPDSIPKQMCLCHGSVATNLLRG